MKYIVVDVRSILELGRARGMTDLTDSYELLVRKTEELDAAVAKLVASFDIAQALGDQDQMMRCDQAAQRALGCRALLLQELSAHPLPTTIELQTGLFRQLSLREPEVGRG